eukprot:m.85341 g.85341  ORF g.85341 m.85341 type:complete len:222 (-) comp14842_c1_seq2:265-930(-)
MGAKSGPTIGSATAPMISAAGKDHVIFSKKLVGLVAVVVVTTGFVFFTIEQSRISSNLAASRTALAQNNAIKNANNLLEQARGELQSEEDELVDMYSKWLDQDSEDLELSNEQLEQLKEQLKTIQQKVQANSDQLKAKEATLEEKEKRLQSYQFKIQQKQNFIDQMKTVLEKLDIKVPVGTEIDQPAPDAEYFWDDEVPADDYYDEYYTGDDDWMNDEEWF